MEKVVGELEGVLVKEPDWFPYLMLVAFEASGPIRFALLLLFWPVVRFLGLLGLRDFGFKLAVFIAVTGVRISELEYVGRAVLPKFYMDSIDMEAWRVFNQYGKRVVVSKSPRVMVEWFAKEHLGADYVVGGELSVNRFKRATGMITDVGVMSSRVEKVLGGKVPCLGLGRPNSEIHFGSTSFMSLCEEQCHPPFPPTSPSKHNQQRSHLKHPVPVVFHDGHLVMFPKPATALLILLWLPIGVIISFIRLAICFIFPISFLPLLHGELLVVKGDPPKQVSASDSSSGVLFVCNHRTFMDPIIVAVALGRKISVVTYSLSRFTEFFSPLPTIRLTRNRQVDANKIEEELKIRDTIVCPEGTTCREPFLLRFSALFAELSDQIVPVAINYKPTFFHPTTARGCKAFDPIYFLMNPISFYEVTFLDKLPCTATCASGKSSFDVANDVQGLLAAMLGFECTNFTRKGKYMFLKGNDGRV